MLLKARANPHLTDMMGCSPLLLSSWRMQDGSRYEWLLSVQAVLLTSHSSLLLLLSVGGSRMQQLLSSWTLGETEQSSPGVPLSSSQGATTSRSAAAGSGQSVSMR